MTFSLLCSLICLLNCPVARAGTAAAPQDETTVFPDPRPEGRVLTLDDCYKLALAQSEAVAIKKEAISRASADMFLAASEALGDVNFVVTRELQETQKELVSTGSVTSTGAFNDPDISQQRFTIRQPLFQQL